MFITALSIIGWKQPRYPSAKEWIKQTVIHPYQDYFAIKRNGQTHIAGRNPKDKKTQTTSV